jgi:Domain of unknown function (DUF4252)
MAVLCAALAVPVRAAQHVEGRVDFGPFTPPGNGEFVEVNLSTELIAMAARLTSKEEPEVTDLLKGVEAVRVNVIGLDDRNRAETQARVRTIRGQLEAKGWERIVTAKDKDQDVVIYLKTRGQEAVSGLAVTVLDGERQVVLVNIIGDIRPEKLALLGEKLDIDPLRKLGQMSSKTAEKSDSKPAEKTAEKSADKP